MTTLTKILAPALLAFPSASLALTLPENSKTPYAIVPGPSQQEQTAAKELADYLHQVTGATFPIAPKATGPAIHVNFAKDPAPLGTDGIVIKTDGQDLTLSGGIPRGPINAVHTFLEDSVGVHWWTSSDTTVPSKPTLTIDDPNLTYIPKFRYREAFNYDPNTRGLFACRLRLNGDHDEVPLEWGGHYQILGFVHTSFPLLPPDKYFAAHPDWYAMVGGKRQAGSQLCLSNPAMKAELVKRALKWIAKNPHAGMISISQNDTFGPCECDDCKKIVAEEGAQSGPWIRLVNSVAEEINKQYPDFLVETLAYQYTRKPPKLTHPSDHVIVRLCSIEADFAHPLSGPTNTSFGDDLRGWAAIAPNLFIWNYTTSFADYLIPFPNLKPLGPDLQFFANNKVISVFEEGDYHNDLAGDFLPLRVWLTAHLLWDPSQDEQKLIDEFCNGYYGAAGPMMIDYVKLVNAADDKPDFRLTCGNHSTAFLSDADLAKADALFADAAAAIANDPQLSRRIHRERLALDHVHLLRYNFRAELAKFTATTPTQTAAQELLRDDFKSKAAEFIKTAPPMGVRNYSEGQLFAAYAPSLLARCDHFLSALNSAGKTMPAGAIDIQEDAFRLYKPGQLVSLVNDPKASDHRAAKMPNTHAEWAVQAEIPDAAIGKGPWKCHFVVRVHGKAPAGSAFTYGIYDRSRGMLASGDGTMEVAGDDEYHTYTLIVPQLNPGCYFWIAPTHMDEVDSVSVDHLYITKAAK